MTDGRIRLSLLRTPYLRVSEEDEDDDEDDDEEDEDDDEDGRPRERGTLLSLDDSSSPMLAFVETQSGSLKPRHSYVGTRFPIVETRVDFFLSNGQPPSRILLSSASEKRAQTNGRTTRIFRAQHLLPHTHQMVSSSSVPKLTPHRFTNKLTKVPCDNPARFTP